MYGCLLLVFAGSVSAAQQISGNKQAGITQFWTDDYKVFDQIYGKTSDKDIYGGSLPTSVSYGVDATNYKNLDIFKPTKEVKSIDDAQASGSQIDAYGFGDNFAHLRQKIKLTKDNFKPSKNSNSFVYNAFKPISEESDPETYDYLKHLEEMGKQLEYPQKSLASFQPTTYGDNFRANSAVDFKSIQDILDAHEAKKKEPKYVGDGDEVKYINYPASQNSRGKGKKPHGRVNPSSSMNPSRCGGKNQGRCRKRSNYKPSSNYVRYSRPRPLIRKIKTIVTE